MFVSNAENRCGTNSLHLRLRFHLLNANVNEAEADARTNANVTCKQSFNINGYGTCFVRSPVFVPEILSVASDI